MLVLISGLAGSGKDTAAKILEELFLFKTHSFAARVKDGVSVIYGIDRGLLEGDNQKSRDFREVPIQFWSDWLGRKITPRILLQNLAEECLRQRFCEDIWALIVYQEILKDPYSNHVVSDARYPNEIKVAKQLGLDPIHIRILRDGVEKRDHKSETSLDESMADYVVDNNGTLEDLKADLLIIITREMNKRVVGEVRLDE